MSADLRRRLARGDVLVADGATGTLLQHAGLPAGEPPEAWNLSRPEVVVGIAARYAAAGADIVHTNSFGGSPLQLAGHGLAERTDAVNRAAAALARRGAGAGVLVSGSLGPCGKLLVPHGDADPAEVRAGFLRQARALLAGGADLLTIETMIDLQEAVLAAAAAREAAGDRVVMATLTFAPSPRGWFTVMGDDVGAAAAALAGAGADVVGANCGEGSAGLLAVAREFAAATELPLLIQPNAGLPILQGGEVRYPEDPDHMAACVPDLVAAGVRVIGGCCGTTPAHVAALVRARDALRGAS